MTLTDDELIAGFDAAVGVFTAIPPDRFDTPVPACPGWTLQDLVSHLGAIHRWVTLILTTRPEGRPPRDDGPLPPGTDPRTYVVEGAAELRAALTGADLDEPIWTFTGRHPARFWLRRQVHETTVHAIDAADASGQAFTVEPRVAVDGVDELVTVLVPLRFDHAAFAGGGETAHLHATDARGEWLLRFDPGGVAVTHEHAKGDVAARGPAADLLRLVWGRTPGLQLSIFGDVSVLDRYRSATRF